MRQSTLSIRRRVLSWTNGIVYIVWAFEWLWVCLLYIDQFFQTPVGKIIKPDVSFEEPPVLPSHAADSFGLPMSVTMLLAVLGGIVLIAAVVYAMSKIYVPDVQRLARKTIQKTAVVATERVIKVHTMTKKKQRTMTVRIAFWLKAIVSLLPVLVVFAISASSPAIPREFAKAGILLLAVPTFILVLFHRILEHYWRVNEFVA